MTLAGPVAPGLFVGGTVVFFVRVAALTLAT